VDRLPGTRLPSIELPATDGSRVALDRLPGLTVVFVFPGIGGPRSGSLEEWKAVPGAFGCTSEACSFRDELAGFREAGVDVLGLSAQPTARLRQAVDEHRLPYPLLSDEELRLADLLPTFEFDGHSYYERITLIVRDGTIEDTLYPVSPPEAGAAQALSWIEERRRRP
jgi:peroxiredoxin